MVEKSKQDETSQNSAPVKKYKAGTLNLNVWENKIEDNIIKSYTIQRSYKDKEDNWQHTTNIRTSDLPKLKVLIELAYKDSIIQ